MDLYYLANLMLLAAITYGVIRLCVRLGEKL